MSPRPSDTTTRQDEVELVVLGVAQDGGHPQAGCRRACCREAWENPARRHRVACLGLHDPRAGSSFLVEATPDLPEQLMALERRYAPPDEPGLAGVLLTHAHIGHYAGLTQFGREVMGARALPLYVLPRMAAFLQENGPWSQLFALGNLSPRPLRDGVETALTPSLAVTPLIVPHRDEFSETVGFVFRGPRRRALFLPDIDKWERWRRPIEALLDEVDLAFLDGTFYDEGELPGRAMAEIPHPLVVESLARLGALPAALRERVRFIHLNHTNPLLDPDSDASRQLLSAGFRVAMEGEVHRL